MKEIKRINIRARRVYDLLRGSFRRFHRARERGIAKGVKDEQRSYSD